jgi:hypothetical protein
LSTFEIRPYSHLHHYQCPETNPDAASWMSPLAANLARRPNVSPDASDDVEQTAAMSQYCYYRYRSCLLFVISMITWL